MFLTAERIIGDYVVNSEKEFTQMIKNGRNPFSKYLPYLAYDPERKVYLNKDGSLGFIFLCDPLWGDSEKARKIVASCIKELPEEGTLSFHFVSCDYLEPYFRNYLADKKVRNNPLIEKCANSHVDFLRRCTRDGIPHMFGTPLRDFLLIVSASYPVKDQMRELESDWLREARASLNEQLKGAGLNPVNMDPDLLIRFLFNLFNGYWNERIGWQRSKPISSQIILADTSINFEWDRVRVGDNCWACITPKNLPAEWDTSEIAELTGPKDGPISDSRQITAHFMFTVTVRFDPALHSRIIKKAGLFFNQLKGDASKSVIGRLIGEYAQEHSEAATEIEKGERYYYVVPMLWIWHREREKLKSAVQKAKNLFVSKGFVPQEERGLLNVLFPLQFPLNFRLKASQIESLDRHFVLKAKEAAGLIPIEGDITGAGNPATFFISRKGQLVSFDPFYKGASNKNCVVFGSTGGGKSFNLNVLVYALYASGALIRIIDLGYSYQKQCNLFGGDYVDFSVEEPISLNPFTFINADDSEDVAGALDSIVEMLLTMVFTGTDEPLRKEHRALLHYATRWAWREFGNDADVNAIYRYLAEFPHWAGDEVEELCKEPDEGCVPDLRNEAQRMAFALARWTDQGSFGKWVNGKATIDLRSSDFIVLEVEKLKRIPALLHVVSLLVVNAASASMYLSDRDRKKVLLFEECGILLKDNPYLESTIKEAYRRARKYNGAAITVFQSPLDLVALGEGGKVIAGNSAYTFYLPSDQYQAAVKEEFLGITKEMASILSEIRLVKPRYGEVGLKTPWGFGVVRTIIPGFLYYLITTDPDDWKAVTEKVRERLSGMKKIDHETKTRVLAGVLEELGRKRDEDFWQRFGSND